MKILMAERSDIFHDVRVLKEANSLVNAGFKVSIIGLRDSEYISEHFPFEIKTFRMLTRKYKKLRKLHLIFLVILLNILAIFRKSDFYHSHNTMILIGMWISARIHGGILIYDSHEVQWEQSKIESLLEKLFIKKAAHVINVSEGRARLQAKRYNINESKITVIWNYPAITKEFNIQFKNKNSTVRFIYSGGFHLGSNKLDIFITALTKYPNLYFDLMAFGYGEDGGKLQNLIKLLDVTDRVKFVPLVSPGEVIQKISRYDFAVNMLVNPANMDYLNYPSINKVYEYLAAGLPLFCSNLPSFEEEFVSTGTGYSVNPFDLKSVEEGLEKIIDLPEEQFLAMKEKARDLAKNYYNWSTQEIKLINLYKNIQSLKEVPNEKHYEEYERRQS